MILNHLLDREINIGYNSNPSYYSNKIVKTYFDSSQNLYRYKIDTPESDFPSKINFLSFSQDGNYMVTANLNRLLFWDLNSSFEFEKLKQIETDIGIVILCVSLNNDASKIIYGGNNFRKKNYNLHVNDTATGKNIQKLFTYSTLEDITLNPINSNIVTFSNSNRKIYSCDLRSSVLNEIKIKNLDRKPLIYSLQYHPIQDNIILVSTNCKSEVFSFDLRNGQIIRNYELSYHKRSISNRAFYNRKGTQIIVEKSNVGPILFNSKESKPIYEFDEFGYYSSILGCFCCFAGIEDEYIVAGSRNCNVYIWETPKDNLKNEIIFKKIDKTKFILKGHTSEVNGVSYNYSKSLLASIDYDEKLFFWSPFSLFLNSKNIECNFSNDTSHEINLRYDNSDIREIDNFFIFRLLNIHMFLFSIRNQFGFYFKKIINMKTKEMEKCFIENSSIQFIHSFIIQFKNNGKTIISKLLERFRNVLEQNSEINSTLNSQYLSDLYESKKVFENKFIIKNSIDFLKLHINLTKKTKKKLVFLIKKKPSTDKLERLKCLEKIKFIMKIMIYDLIIIFELSKELYEVSFNLMKKLLTQIDNSDNLDFLRVKLLESIYKLNDNVTNDDNNITVNQINVNSNDIHSNSDANSSNINLDSSDNETISSNNDANSNSNQTNSNNSELNSNNNEINSNISNRNFNDNDINLNTSSTVNDATSSNDYTTNSNIHFCVSLKDSLNFSENYNDDVVSKLFNNTVFKQNLKKKYNSLK